MRTGTTHRERTNQNAERHSPAFLKPAGHHFQTAGIHTGESNSSQESQRECYPRLAGAEGKERNVECRSGETGEHKESASGNDVRHAEHTRN